MLEPGFEMRNLGFCPDPMNKSWLDLWLSFLFDYFVPRTIFFYVGGEYYDNLRQGSLNEYHICTCSTGDCCVCNTVDAIT